MFRICTVSRFTYSKRVLRLPVGLIIIIVDQGVTRQPVSSFHDQRRQVRAVSVGSGTGGHITDYVHYSGIWAMVVTISNMLGLTSTPPENTLYEAVRYFRQESTYYSTATISKAARDNFRHFQVCRRPAPTANDPYYFVFIYPTIPSRYVPCAKSYIILMTDGEPLWINHAGDSHVCALLRLHLNEYKSVFRLWRSSQQPQPHICRHSDKGNIHVAAWII